MNVFFFHPSIQGCGNDQEGVRHFGEPELPAAAYGLLE
jgi:hypothetical protein